MSGPSKEAMAVAEKLVRMEVAHETPDCTLVVAGVELYSVNASQGYMSEMYDTVCELQAGIATALDAHTADLQREVEALRAERDKCTDLATIWGWIQRYGGVLNENGVVLYSPNEIATRIDLIHNGEDWLPAAAEWVRNHSE